MNNISDRIYSCTNPYKYCSDCSLTKFGSKESFKVTWNQKVCFDTPFSEPVSPGKYEIDVECQAWHQASPDQIKNSDVIMPGGKYPYTLSYFMPVEITINEPALNSCGTKRDFEVKKLTYGPDKNHVVVEIENKSKSDIQNLAVRKDCALPNWSDEVDILGGLKSGEKKVFSFDHSCRKLDWFYFYATECVGDYAYKEYRYHSWFDDLDTKK